MTNPAQWNKDSEIEKLFAPEEQALIKKYYSAGVSLERAKAAWEAAERTCNDLGFCPVEQPDKSEAKEWRRTKSVQHAALEKFDAIRDQVQAKTWDTPHHTFFNDNGLGL